MPEDPIVESTVSARHRPTERPVIVIGGGPAGLTSAYELTRRGQRPVVLEKNHMVGGLARTEQFRGNYFDLGGHRFFTPVREIQALWTQVLGEDFLLRPRQSRIYYDRKFFDYPLRPLNALWALGPIESIRVVLSYLRWHLFPYRQEETFEQWVTNRFGKRLFNVFFKSYTEKVWGISCDRLRAEWAAQRIKDLSMKSIVKHMLLKSTQQIRTLIEEFHYPRRGPGMMWQAFASVVQHQGGEVRLQSDVTRVCRQADNSWSVTVRCGGRTEQIHGKAIISSMPVTELIAKLEPSPPEDVLDAASRLTYRDFLTVCLVVDKPTLFTDNWIYVHDPEVSVARIQNFKNWSPDKVADRTTTTLGLEYFCTEGDELWNTPDADLIELGRRELQRIGLAAAEDVIDGCVFRVPKAYPIYDAGYRDHLERVRSFLRGQANLQTVGRNGLHRYNNQDHAMLTGLLAVRNLLCGETHDLWQVNAEQGYQEHARVERV